MTGWTKDELSKIEKADELELASLGEDGTLRRPVTIWVVRVDDDLYVRAYRGRSSVWFRNTQFHHAGRISAGGVAKDVTFVDVSRDEALNKKIDATYRSKYRSYSATYVDPMVAPQARAATLRLVPSNPFINEDP
jgi:hypothetical protein